MRVKAFPLPPFAEQLSITRRVSTLFQIADRIESRYAKAKKQVNGLTQSVLSQAFQGELVSQDSKDEPASALLARLAEHKGARRSRP
jgi:type I restriction enzyme S subunit